MMGREQTEREERKGKKDIVVVGKFHRRQYHYHYHHYQHLCYCYYHGYRCNHREKIR